MVVTWATVDGIIGYGMLPGGWEDGLGASIGWLMACWYRCRGLDAQY